MTFTTSVNRSSLKRWFWDRWGRMNRLPYRDFLIATPEMAGLFHIPEWKSCYLTRWGMKPISKVNKEFDSIRLLYIGVLNNRNIHQTIYGLKLFIERNPGVSVTYSIIGSGDGEHVRLLADAISACKLETTVKYHGYLPNDEILPFFEKCNVGVSYVPITPYYTDVIVTKTVEYLLSGMVVVATDTNKNREAINDQNGVLIPDNPQGFADGLEKVYSRLTAYDSSLIMEGAKEWNVEFQIRTSIVPILKSVSAK
jgi:glycosyltransferase involved in cell wall biosynthesis